MSERRNEIEAARMQSHLDQRLSHAVEIIGDIEAQATKVGVDPGEVLISTQHQLMTMTPETLRAWPDPPLDMVILMARLGWGYAIEAAARRDDDAT